jgi:competence protein ComEC
VPAFTVEQWLKADGDARKPADPTVRSGTRCDPIGCTVQLPDGRFVSYLEDRRGFGEDCRRAAIVLSRLAAPPGCAATIVIDRGFLAAHGASAVRATETGFSVVTSRRPDESRPWLSKGPARIAGSAAAPRARASPPGGPEQPGTEPRPERSAEPDLPPAEAPDGDPGP